ncbi:hypothetical protein KDW_54950 [Dictyobacter vulcani]|uniref:Protease n=1 Tax=Dictyobacter vulcani TaxID=2607529 RepID=A0A5J4KUT0_9CHLR|nr:trypsin-like peptidase domain-containing protein [Dictyobacter vulcani]GER91333.1 hypothetical protein KDW_54950 [Dictyobacter vulcani]
MYGPDEDQQFAAQNTLAGPSRPDPPAKRSLTSGIIAICALLLAIVFGGGMLAGWQFADRGILGDLQTGNAAGPDGDDREALREQVIASVEPAVVQINVSGSSNNSVGSGVVIDRRGYIITNNHVVEGRQSVQVVFATGQAVMGSLVGGSAAEDLAVVQVDPAQVKLSVATLGDSSKLRVGQDVMAIGNPLGITQTVTNGIISALDRNVANGDNGQMLSGAIQTDAPINPGNSGGALVDMHGQLIGIPTLAAINPETKTPANGVGFAIPSNRVKVIAPQLIKHSKMS